MINQSEESEFSKYLDIHFKLGLLRNEGYIEALEYQSLGMS